MDLKLRKTTITCLISMGVLVWLQASAVASPLTPTNNWNPPLDTPIRLVNQYRQPNSDYSAGHRGVDYLVEAGQPILAPADGQVWYVGKIVDRPVLSVLHPGGYLTEYEPACTDLKKGEIVFAGQQIGMVCAADANYRQHCSSDNCLHFSLRSNGAYLSPLIFIGGLNPSRLLPMLEDARSYTHPEGAL
jgi:murein DD-endopeptidase MepM/ murein hydrolase activator NlpD